MDPATLSQLARRALQSETVELLDWEVSPLGSGFGNPTSLGLYRVSGRGQDGGRIVPWSLALKAMQSPANAGRADIGVEQDHWNYWKREILAYQSTLLGDLPGGFLAPRFMGANEQPGDVGWLWLEDIRDFAQAVWSLDDLRTAARHLGQFNGAYLAGRALPEGAWLSRGLIRPWCRDFGPVVVGPLERLEQADGPFALLHELAPASQVAAFVRCIRTPEPLLSALERLPQTLCHHDANPNNLLIRSADRERGQIVAADWQMVGYGPIGEDAGQFLTTSLSLNLVAGWQELDAALFESYVSGLHEAGWRGDTRQARFGCVASAVLREGFFQLFLLGDALAEGEPGTHPSPVEGLIRNQAELFRLLFALAAEAEVLAEE
jgi:hypothetical protein